MALVVHFKTNPEYTDVWFEGVKKYLNEDLGQLLLTKINALILEYLKHNYSAAPHSFQFFPERKLFHEIDFISTIEPLAKRGLQITLMRGDLIRMMVEEQDGSLSMHDEPSAYEYLSTDEYFFKENLGFVDKILLQTVYVSRIAVYTIAGYDQRRSILRASPPNCHFVAGACSRDLSLIFAATNQSTIATYGLYDLVLRGQYPLPQPLIISRMSANNTTLVMMEANGNCHFWDIETHAVISTLMPAVTSTINVTIFNLTDCWLTKSGILFLSWKNGKDKMPLLTAHHFAGPRTGQSPLESGMIALNDQDGAWYSVDEPYEFRMRLHRGNLWNLAWST